MKKSNAFILILAGIVWSACKVFDNEVVVPAYIYVPSYTFQTRAEGPNGNEGDSTSRFLDMWIFTKGNIEGGFGLPTLIPIQRQGLTEIGVDAGILRSGQNNERLPYPLVDRYFTTLNLQPGKVDTIIPTFKYVDGITFKMIEDFDRIGNRFEFNIRQEGDTLIRFTGDSARNKERFSGRLILTDSSDFVRLVTVDEFNLNARVSPVYLEMDYNTDVILFVGLFVSDASGSTVRQVPLFNAFPTSGWNRVYIDLTKDITTLPLDNRYKLYIQLIRSKGSPMPNVMLDNIKLIEG